MAIINYTIEALLGSAAELAALNPLLLDGQIGKEVDTGLFKIGNGVLNWNSIPYAVLNETTSVFFGRSTDAGNLLSNSVTDGGLVLSQQVLNTESEINNVMSGTLTLADRANYALNSQHRLATLILSVYVKRILGALGTDFSVVTSAQGYTGTTIQDAIAALQTAVGDLADAQEATINDTVESSLSTWSSEKIASSILSAVNGLRNQLVGSAGEALDTIYELAEALNSNSSYITTLLAEVANSVKVTEQTFTLEQKAQARLNIGAAEAALVGTYEEIGGQTLEDILGNLDGETAAGDPPSLGEVAEKVNVALARTHTLGCSLYKTNYNEPTGQYLNLTWNRSDGTLAATSVLSNLSATYEGLYTTRTETLFAADGVTTIKTTVYTLSYDIYRNVVSEVITSQI